MFNLGSSGSGLWSNYFIAGWRASSRDKINFCLTVVGLSIGMAASLLIALYSIHESSYDEFQPNAERTYRVVQHHIPSGNNHPVTTPRADQHLKKIPHVEDAFQLVRSQWPNNTRVKVGQQSFKLEKNYSATTNISDFIKINVLQGTLTDSLTQPNNIALSESEAIRLFGTTNIIGDSLHLTASPYELTLTVGAVFSDMPNNSHFAINSLVKVGDLTRIIGSHSFTYIRLSEKADVNLISKNISQIFADIWGWNINELTFILQPMLNIHLDSNIRHDMKIGGSAKTVSITIMLSILILIISSFNYVNMSIAQGSRRAKEVGVRKVLGAGRLKLVFQFISESIVIALFSALIACSLVELVLESFNQLVGRELEIGNWSQMALPVIVITIMVGVFSGIYPALFISSFNVKRVLSGDLQRGKTAIIVRKFSMLIQSVLSVALIIAAVNLYLQLNYLQSLPVNYEKHNRLKVADAPDNIIYSDLNDDFYQALRKIDGVKSATPIDFELTKDFYAGVSNISIAGIKPFSNGMGYGGVGFNAAQTLGLEMLAGRDFSKQFSSDWFNQKNKTLSIMIPESILAISGYASAEDAIGKVWQFSAGRYGAVKGKIVGVFKDIKIGSVRDGDTPVLLGCGMTWSGMYSVLIEVEDQHSTKTQNDIRELMHARLNINPVEVQLIEANYMALYHEDDRLTKTVAIFSALAIFITCIGMFGLAAYSAQRRNREVAVRKVLGASRLSLVVLLTKESINLVILSLVIAFPLAYYFINDWLSHFSQRIEQSVWVYGLAGMIVAIITWLTVLSIAIHSASKRPAGVLRYE